MAKVAGKGVIKPALQLFYAYQRPETPLWAKSIIIGAIGYFICPIDAVPDVMVPVGYLDDAAVLAAAIAAVAIYIDDEVNRMANNKLRQWFGN